MFVAESPRDSGRTTTCTRREPEREIPVVVLEREPA